MNTPHPVSDEVRYRILRHLAAHPDATQRELAKELGVSIGKAHYCLRALVEKGLLKVRNFKNSRNKAAYVYVLTRRGAEEKLEITRAFLRRKMEEYDGLAVEIARLAAEVGVGASRPDDQQEADPTQSRSGNSAASAIQHEQ